MNNLYKEISKKGSLKENANSYLRQILIFCNLEKVTQARSMWYDLRYTHWNFIKSYLVYDYNKVFSQPWVIFAQLLRTRCLYNVQRGDKYTLFKKHYRKDKKRSLDDFVKRLHRGYY